MATKKKNSRNRPNPKISSRKQEQQAIQKLQPYFQRTVHFNKLDEELSYVPSPTRNLGPTSSYNSGDEVRVFNSNRVCTTRTAIVTFIIVVILVIAAGASLGIVFAVINSSSSSGTGNNNNNNNNNMNSFTTITSGSQTSSVRIGTQTGPPCSGYTEINDPTRSINYVETRSGCDNGALFNTSNGGAWIRFVGTGGTKLALASVSRNRCGAYLTGWYNGTLPTATNVMKNGTICFDGETHTCNFVSSLSIILCPGTPSNYHIFFLPPTTVCSARYCTQ